MRDYPFSPIQLAEFSSSLPYHKKKLQGPDKILLDELEAARVRLNFPAISSDIGSFLCFLWKLTRPKRIFEMGSGYGHSAFWHLLGGGDELLEVVLTEKRADLVDVFHSLSWPKRWKSKLDYFQGDAFAYPFSPNKLFDVFLIDGVKAHYLDFSKVILDRLNVGGIIVIDNSYWRGSFLDEEIRNTKSSAKKIFELHEWIAGEERVEAVFLPYPDGLTLLRKLF